MRKTITIVKKILCFFSSVAMLSACADDLENEIAQGGEPLVISAQCADTKSTLSADFDVLWGVDDRITVLSLDGSVSAVSEPGGAESVSCDFRVKSWPGTADPRYAIFNGTSEEPVASIEGRYIRASIKTEQRISDEGSFARDANLSIGELALSEKGSWQTQMKNVCALIGFSLGRFDNVKKVSVYDRSGNNALTGSFDIFMEDGVPVIKSVAQGKSYATVSISDGEGCFKLGTNYYICVRPGVEFMPYFEFLLEDGQRYKSKSANMVSIRRSTVMHFDDVDAEAEESGVDPFASNENFVDGGSAELDIWVNKLVAGYHPRLVFSESEFGQLKGMVGGDNVVGKLHAHLISVADRALKSTNRFTSHLYDDGTYISRDAAVRLISCAYAYRMTSLQKYLDKALQDIKDVCVLETWGHEDSYLDVGELSAAVAITYDWIYDSMSEALRGTVVNALKTLALETSREDQWWYRRAGNWNQVCNSGLVCSAVAIYEHCPQLAQEVIDDAISTNRVAVEGIYAPDGAYPEGPTYWSFGAIFQTLMLTVFEDVFGTDYGISSAPGFLDTGLFKVFARGPNNMQFNYADSGLSATSAYPLFYFAYKRNDPSLLYAELKFLDEASYRNSGHKCYMIIPLKYAMRMNLEGVTGMDEKFYAAQGNVPLMMCRSGWEDDDDYLGIKGGKDGDLHGHMDGGSFVYYDEGLQWAMDVEHESYDNIRPIIHAMGGKLFDMSQTSLRWKLFRMHSRQHNTLTVNDKDHNVNAFVEMVSTENTPSRMGATFDLTPLFDGDLAKAERTAALCDDEYLEIKDVLKAPAGRSAHVRWTLMTKATPTVTSDGITLVSGSFRKKLQTQGGKVTYKIWSSDINDYDNILMKDGKPIESPLDSDISICGYEIDIPAGAELTLVTTMKQY